MEGLAEEARDFSLLRLLYVYKKISSSIYRQDFCQGITQE